MDLRDRHAGLLQPAHRRVEADTPYEPAEELVDIEDAFRAWRFCRLKTVERIVGQRPGTGSSAGVACLKGALEHSFFPELWAVRTWL